MGGLFRLQAYGEVPSTNEIVKRAIEEGEPEGLAVGARVQTAGYGRQGRAWSSPDGGMYLSLLLRPRCALSQLPTLSLVAGVAVRRAIASVSREGAADRVRLKWPNDVVCSPASRCDGAGGGELSAALPGRGSEGAPAPFGKLAGISLESHAGGICVGVGVNVSAASRPRISSGKYAPAYVSELSSDDVTVEEVRDAVLAQFETCYGRWLEQGFAAFADEYRSHSALGGRIVTVENVDGSFVAQGRVEGVDASGCLLVRGDGADEPMHLSSGEVHLSRIGG